MADVACPQRERRSKILQWHEHVLHFSQPQKLDLILNTSASVTVCVLIIVFVYTYILAHADIHYTETPMCNDMSKHDSTPARSTQRMYNRMFDIMKNKCNKDDTVITSNHILINNESHDYVLVYMCRTNMQLINPITIQRGTHRGMCKESLYNVTKMKHRYFPIMSNITGTQQHVFDTLESACEYEHAIEKLSCTW